MPCFNFRKCEKYVIFSHRQERFWYDGWKCKFSAKQITFISGSIPLKWDACDNTWKQFHLTVKICSEIMWIHTKIFSWWKWHYDKRIIASSIDLGFYKMQYVLIEVWKECHQFNTYIIVSILSLNPKTTPTKLKANKRLILM